MSAHFTQYYSALAIIAEHLFFVWKHAKISANAIPSTIHLYQQLPSCSLVAGQVQEAFTEYSNSIADFGGSGGSRWRHIKNALQNRCVRQFNLTNTYNSHCCRKVKNKVQDVLQEKLYDIVMRNRLGVFYFLPLFG